MTCPDAWQEAAEGIGWAGGRARGLAVRSDQVSCRLTSRGHEEWSLADRGGEAVDVGVGAQKHAKLHGSFPKLL